jgi:glycosyltransferase involved in cell wall biosynthesis
MKIAFVHDYLVQYGGAERVLESLCSVWPDAPIYTLLHDSELVHGKFDQKKIKTSFLQKIPFARKHHRIFPPLMMFGIEQFNFKGFDVVLSDSSSFAKNIVTGPETLHISYCHTPMRYGWDDCQYYTQEFSFPRIVKKAVPFLMNYIRMWDFYSTNGVDKFIANSKFVSARINKYYRRNSHVINPPVDVEKFSIVPKEEVKDYFLLVGRMMKYKKMDLVIQAFTELGLPLKVVGRGVEYSNLKKIAGPNVEFLGRVSDEELRRIYSQAQAFLFPQEEDFGIVAIEALAAGRPLIAYHGGDIVEHVREGESAVFFHEQTVDALKDAVRRFKEIEFDPEKIRETSLGFSGNRFKSQIKEFVESQYEEFKRQQVQSSGVFAETFR